MQNNVVDKVVNVSVPTSCVAASLVGVALVVTIVDLAARAIVTKVVPPPCSPMKPSIIMANTWTMNNVVDKVVNVSVPTSCVAVSLVGVALVVTTVDLAARATVTEVVPPPCSPMKPSIIMANIWMMVISTDR
ncbi:hypothetical protein RDI58_017430 [Solanum bulbocastanum]|uniref:Uncharacterized protein n=1 Tax=Solanum bulbocastanum TaxID=147425 RepID=A0AAN8TEN1_SOLBU